LDKKFYKSIIPFNKRNTKDKNKIKVLTNEEKKLYKSRINIENTFLKIKKNRRLETVYEKKSENFLSLIYLSSIKLII
jgi:transposase